ncbi:uncharacterized protein [Miscanthus floridulus]|uniref:uncharacterized protein n=1 Tax=Miscanthus floridulus TaxID=154761 RepID=UPI0034574A24
MAPPLIVPTQVYISSGGISSSEFVQLPDASCPVVSAELGFRDLLVPNIWDCRNGLVLFEFGGETCHRAGLPVRFLLMYPNMDKAMRGPPPRAPRRRCAPRRPAPGRFNRLSWSRPGAVEGDSFALGLLAGGLSDGSVAVWNPLSMISSEGKAEDAMVARLEKHTGPVCGLEFSELTPNRLGSGAEHGELCIWDLKNPVEPIVYPPYSRYLQFCTELIVIQED